jgi:hypothetical protein
MTTEPSHPSAPGRGVRRLAIVLAAMVLVAAAVGAVLLTRPAPQLHNPTQGLPDIYAPANQTVSTGDLFSPSQLIVPAGVQYLAFENRDAIPHVIDIPLQTRSVEDMSGSAATVTRQSPTDMIVSLPAGSRAVASVDVVGAGSGPSHCVNGAMSGHAMGTAHMMGTVGMTGSASPMAGAPMNSGVAAPTPL